MHTDADYREAFADADGDMPEYVTTLHGGMVAVDKDGGGTLGKEYEGTWTVSVMNGPVYVLDGTELNTGTPKTHEQVAHLAYAFAADEDDETLARQGLFNGPEIAGQQWRSLGGIVTNF